MGNENMNKEVEVEEHFKKGNKFLDSGENKNAIKEYNKVISANPKDDVALRNRGRAFHNSGKYKKALDDYNKSLEISPEYFEALCARGDLFDDMGKYEEAIKDYSDALDFDFEDDEVYFNRATVYEKLEKYDLALIDYTSSIQYNKNDHSSYYNRGKLYRKMEEYEKAIADYSEAIKIKPKYTWALCSRAHAYSKLNQLELAIEDYSEALRIQPGDDEIYNNRGSVFSLLGKVDESIEDYSSAIRINRKNDRSYYNRAIAYDKKKEYERSLEDYTIYIKMNPSDCEAISNRGCCYQLLKKMDPAIKDFSTCIRLNKEFGIAFYNRGVCYEEQLKFDESLKDLDIAASLRPSDHRVFCTRGIVFGQMKKFEDAIGEYSRAIKINPRYDTAYSNRGICFQKLGKFEDAKFDFLKAIRINPTDEYYLCNLADLFLEVGEREACDKYYKMAIERNPQKGFVYGRRMYSLEKIDEERALDDFRRIMKIYNTEKLEKGEKDEEVESGIVPEEILNIYERLEKKKLHPRTETGYSFLRDLRKDEDIEREELEELRKEISSFFEGRETDDERIQVYRFVGKGAYCRTYLCRILNFTGIYVLKVSKVRSNQRVEKMFEKEKVRIPYHRNIVMNLSEDFSGLQKFDTRKFADYEKWWKDDQMFSDDDPFLTTPITLMKFYRQDLGVYVEERKKNKSPFTEVELVNMICGLLDGVNHLHKLMIVHRDLHIGNVFVDELYGRIYIGDFGCSINLSFQNSFKVSTSEKIVTTFYYSSKVLVKGGSKMFMPPEILDHRGLGDDIVLLDFEKYDLFSVGTLGYFLISEFTDDFAPFGVDDEGDPVTKGRKMKNYKELKKCKFEKLKKLIKGILEVDPVKRLDYDQALEKAKVIQSTLIEKNDNEEEEMEGED